MGSTPQIDDADYLAGLPGLAGVAQLGDRLSAMVEPITAAVTRLKTETTAGVVESPGLAYAVDELLRMRARRQAIFGELITDAAWAILLCLYRAQLYQRRTWIGNVCDGADVPLTTGLRWIERLRCVGFVLVRPDPLDHRRKFVELSPQGSETLKRYFSELPATNAA